MGNQIIKQPNNKYCIFSSITDNFILLDATHDELVDFIVEAESKEIQRRIYKILAEIKNGDKPYLQFTKTWEQALKTATDINGNKNRMVKYANKIKSE